MIIGYIQKKLILNGFCNGVPCGVWFNLNKAALE